MQIGNQSLTVNTGAIPASSPRLPLALQLGNIIVTERAQHSNAVFIYVTGALSGSYNPTLTAITLTANSAWIERTGCFLVSVSESKQELLGVLLCLLYYPTLFDLAFLALLKEPFNFLDWPFLCRPRHYQLERKLRCSGRRFAPERSD